jgi:hypothetical protein
MNAIAKLTAIIFKGKKEIPQGQGLRFRLNCLNLKEPTNSSQITKIFLQFLMYLRK